MTPRASRARVLGVSTSGAQCSAALYDAASATLTSATAPGEAGRAVHSTQVLALIDELLRGGGFGPGALTAIAVDVGPGAFTGIRLGLAVSQGIALAHGLPLVPVCSLRALAWQSRWAGGWPVEAIAEGGRPQAEPPVRVAIDARMDEVYWLLDTGDGPIGLPPAGSVEVGPASAAVAAFGGTGPGDPSVGAWPRLAGDAFVRVPELVAFAAGLGGPPPTSLRHPSGDAVALIGSLAWAAGESRPASEVAPLYVRDRVALDRDAQAALRARRAAAGLGA